MTPIRMPYITRACFPSVCAETGEQIKRGDVIAYYPHTRKAYCASSYKAERLFPGNPMPTHQSRAKQARK